MTPRSEPLSNEEVRRFLLEGFLIAGQVLDEQQVGTIRDVLDAILERGASEGTVVTDLVRDRTIGSAQRDDLRTRFPMLSNLWRSDPLFKELALGSVLGRWAGQLLDADSVRLFADQAFIKMDGESSAELHWHQDWYAYPMDPPSVVSCWIALDDVTLHNGAMEMAVGTHTLGRFLPVDAVTGEKRADAAEYVRSGMKPLPDPEELGIEIRAVELRAGECSFHDACTWHRSGVNRSSKRRHALIERFMDGAATYVPIETGMYPANQVGGPVLAGKAIADVGLFPVVAVG